MVTEVIGNAWRVTEVIFQNFDASSVLIAPCLPLDF